MYIGNTQNHSGYVSIAHPVTQKVTDTAKEKTDQGNCTIAYSRLRQEAPLLSTAPIQPIAPCFFIRSGSGSDIRSPSRARARTRSIAPKPRHPASAAASTGTPRNVTSRPAPSDTIVTANVKSRMPIGSPSST